MLICLGTEKMKQMGAISAQQFMLHFYEAIRVRVDWHALAASNVQVSCFQIENRVDLGDLHTVWGMKTDGTYEQDHSLRVKDKFSNDREMALGDFPKEFLKADVILLAAPVYECCCGKYVLLDRTHRSIALYRAAKDNFRMVIYAIKAVFVYRRPENCIQCTLKSN
jgi:hypothetical protein